MNRFDIRFHVADFAAATLIDLKLGLQRREKERVRSSQRRARARADRAATVTLASGTTIRIRPIAPKSARLAA